ncbi:MAG TPA: ubiquinol-cytochrome c reductase iron-sulfur subunit [Acidimicrobiales bacterium]|jgi:cytochrome b6-f complex iron-sulfur subunit|nr:ubiquinol-cytochrome c reductase iron-sulfur subunit [Acidimicrobiales bacterium]
METGAILAIAFAVLVILAGVFAFVTTRARDRQSAVGALSRETRKKDKGSEAIRAEDTSRRTGRELERAEARVLVDTRPAPPAPREPLDPEAYGVTRRQFFNRSITTMFALGLAGFGTTVIAFLWPSLSGGFGSKIRAGSASDILSQINDSREPFYVPEGRFYVTPYPKGDVQKAAQHYSGGVLEGMEQGFVALYQKCVHLGCRVPWCKASQWFECPCHGSRYNRVGEKTGGPAPRGLDRFPVSVEGGAVVVDTGALSQGPPVGVDTTGQQAEGPHCA